MFEQLSQSTLVNFPPFRLRIVLLTSSHRTGRSSGSLVILKDVTICLQLKVVQVQIFAIFSPLVESRSAFSEKVIIAVVNDGDLVLTCLGESP